MWGFLNDTLIHLPPDVVGQYCWGLQVYPIFCNGGGSFSGMNEIICLFLKRFTEYAFYLTVGEKILVFFCSIKLCIERETNVQTAEALPLTSLFSSSSFLQLRKMNFSVFAGGVQSWPFWDLGEPQLFLFHWHQVFIRFPRSEDVYRNTSVILFLFCRNWSAYWVFLFYLDYILSTFNVWSCISLHNEDNNFSASISMSDSSWFIHSLLISIVGLAYNSLWNGEDLVGFRTLNHWEPQCFILQARCCTWVDGFLLLTVFLFWAFAKIWG